MGHGINNIWGLQAREFPAGHLRDGALAALPGLVMLQWQSDLAEVFFQVYVNGRLATVTEVAEQRSVLVGYEHEHPAAIEVVWVTADEKYVDYADGLEGFSQGGGSHAEFSFPRRGCLPLGSRAVLFGDNRDGVIDYSKRLAEKEVWPDPMDKWGWGTDAFGRGDFGYSGCGAVGWGCGSLGRGEFGFDADEVILRSEALAGGVYQFVVRIVDEAGNYDDGAVVTEELCIDPLPVAGEVMVNSYDSATDSLVLEIF
ncbi:MAG: hypothetical protein JXD22_13270 [Sedimentisphaerales bacterium]|nr:hypothetical protein [Sedimentisphaerales bacterium]